MAWELISKQEVATLIGAREQELEDLYYDMAIDLIERISGLHNLGVTKTVTDVLNGTGTPTIYVLHPPIVSVTSVSIGGTAVDSRNYTYTDTQIIFKSSVNMTSSTNPNVAKDLVFTEGRKNVSVTYVSGNATPSKDISLAVALIIKEIVGLRKREGVDDNLQFYRPDRSDGMQEQFIFRYGLHGKIKDIVKSLVGARFRVV